MPTDKLPEKLGESERLELYRLLVEEAKDYAIFVLHPDGTVASWNPGAQRIKGSRESEIVGRHFSLFYPAEDVAAGKPEHMLAAAREGGRVEDEGWRLRKDGSRFWASVVITALRDESGNLRGYSKLTRDLTERREAELALREREQQLAVTLASIGDGLIATDNQGHVTFMNPVAERMTGWTGAEARGAPLTQAFRIVNEETRAAVENPVGRVLREGIVVGLANHTVLIARDGTEHPIADTAAPITDPDGRLRGVVLVFQDQTTEREAERAVHESERRLRLLVEGVHDYALYLLDPSGKVASWNSGAERIKGYSASEILGQDFARFFTEEDRAAGAPAEMLSTATTEGRCEREGWRLRKDGSRFWASAIVTPLRDEQGRLEGFAKVTRDLTERRAAEEQRILLERERAAHEATVAHAAELRASEERLRLSQEWLATVLRSIGDAVITTDATGAVTFLNPVAEELTGWRAAQAHGRRLTEVFSIINEETRHRVESPVDRVIREGIVVGLANHTILVRPDGSERFIDDSAAPIRDGSQELVGVVLVFRDISDKRRAEHDRERAHAEAERANRAKDEFLAVLGHELRNPLAPIMTALELMRLRGGDQMARERAIIERQLRHVVRLVEDLLDVSRVTRGKVELRKEPVAVAEVVAKGIEVASPLLEEKRHVVKVSVPPELAVDGDAGRLAQVIANLMNNAAKFTESGGSISVTAEREGEDVAIRVRDNGIGISPEMLPKVFNPFVQQAQTLDRRRGGLGLGLAIVRSLVELHGGSVTARSEGLGRGTEIIVRLPALQSDQAAARSSDEVRSAEPARVGSGPLLLVDDNADAAEVLAAALRLLGYEVHVAYDGPSGLAAAQRVRPEIAILDIGLPVMDGYELAERLHGIEGLDRTKLIALTGYGQESDIARSVEAGFDEHLVKPVDIPTLVRAVQRLTDRN